jgi:hypothetical protein
MTKYREKLVTGEKWRRSFQVLCENRYQQTPYIRFDEEDIVLLEDGTIVNTFNGSRVAEEFTMEKALTEFDLIDPTTDQLIGAKGKYQDVFVLLYSLYHHLANQRDFHEQYGYAPYPSWSFNEETETWEAPVPKPDGEYYWDEQSQTWIEIIEENNEE